MFLGDAFFSMSTDTTAGATLATMSAKLSGAPTGEILGATRPGAFTAPPEGSSALAAAQ